MKFLESWEEKHNWALVVTGIITFLITLVVVMNRHSHIEDMKHIELGHCYTRLAGTERGQWGICK